MSIWRATTKITDGRCETESHRDFAGATDSEASGQAILHTL